MGGSHLSMSCDNLLFLGDVCLFDIIIYNSYFHPIMFVYIGCMLGFVHVYRKLGGVSYTGNETNRLER